METQLQQLKLNVTNIRSVLKSANKQNLNLRKDNKRLISQEIKENKVKRKESKIEKKISSTSSPLAAAKEIASPSMGLFDKVINFGTLLLAGVFANAIPGVFKKIDKFREDNKEIIDAVTTTMGVVKGYASTLFDEITSPYAKEGAFDYIGKFDDNGKLQGGFLKSVEDTFDEFGRLINQIDKALGGKGRIGDYFITEDSLVAQTERGSGLASFREDSAANAALQQRVKSGQTREGEGSTISQARGNYGPYTKAFLDTIAFAEGTYYQPNTGYNTHFAFDQTKDLSAHPALIKSGGGYRSDAFGRYQFMSPTWAGLGGAVNPHDGKPFKSGMNMSPANQDKGAVELTLSRLRNAGYNANNANDLERILKQEGMSKRFAAAMSGEWASFPNVVGVSAYGQPVKKLNSLQNFFRKIIKQPKIEPKKPDKTQASVLNNTMGEEGSTTYILMTQQVLT